LAAHLVAQRRSARWWLEEDKDHPVMPAVLRKTSALPGFDRRCLDAWAEFLARENGDLIVEGAALQSTVRFMFAQGCPEASIWTYWRDWCVLATPRLASFLFLSVTDPPTHYEAVFRRRGAEWTAKLVAYVAATPVARSHGWREEEGFAAFWTAYQALCLRLIADLEVTPVVLADLGYDDLPAAAKGISTPPPSLTAR
jgi:hypothetical protein